MISSVKRPRPVRRPPRPLPAVREAIPRTVPLPVAPLPPAETAPPTTEPAPTPAPAADRAPLLIDDGSPFNQHKILNHFERLHRLARGENVFPITVEIDPSNVCNHHCKWCVSMESHTGEILDIELFVRLVTELQHLPVRSIVLKGGGEPTVHPHFIDMLDAVRRSGLALGLTNGSMPRTGSREKVLECCQWVRISLDAATAATHQRIHGTVDFVRILRNIEYLTRYATGTIIGLNFVAEERNCHEMLSFAQLGRALGVSYVTLRCAFDPGRPLKEETRADMRQQAMAAKRLEDDRFRVFLGDFTDRYLNASRNDPFPYRRCLGPNLIGIIGGDGGAYACCFLRGENRFSFGNIAQHSFAQLWASQRRQQVMEAVYRGECGRICAGGMTANRYNTYNEILNYLAADDKRHVEFA